ncbi:hypothetical protein [Herbidospora sp. NBRC 101105]|uniref:hypothetical protein n=1 Tax=Herbidospora sp. NBRC 101105 TaxID=3032195 RepID=UPI0024A26ED9|nr:hypothetical protein [Herbidospora sp. NBRC 101105]GLX93859.1 hypothetical protein Hesp01_18090 [Herbidospora sp. NBRC 101105]
MKTPAVSLAVPLARAADWLPLGITAPLVLAGAWLVPAEFAGAVVRSAGAVLAAAAAFTLVDGMAATTAATPVPRWVRQWARTLMAAAAAGGGWGAAWWLAGAPGPADALAGEAVAALLLALAGAGWAVRRAEGRSGGRSEGRAVALAGAAPLLAAGAGTWAPVGSGWWWAVVPLLLVVAAAHTDPVRRGRWRGGVIPGTR